MQFNGFICIWNPNLTSKLYITTLYAYMFLHSCKVRVETQECMYPSISSRIFFVLEIHCRLSFCEKHLQYEKIIIDMFEHTLCCAQSRLKRWKRYYLLTSCSSRGSTYYIYTCTFACLYFSRGDTSFCTNLEENYINAFYGTTNKRADEFITEDFHTQDRTTRRNAL